MGKKQMEFHGDVLASVRIAILERDSYQRDIEFNKTDGGLITGMQQRYNRVIDRLEKQRKITERQLQTAQDLYRDFYVGRIHKINAGSYEPASGRDTGEKKNIDKAQKKYALAIAAIPLYDGMDRYRRKMRKIVVNITCLDENEHDVAIRARIPEVRIISLLKDGLEHVERFYDNYVDEDDDL